MDRSCPKRRKTKKILSDGDVKKYLNSNDCDQREKIVHISKVPDDWESGMMLSLYHDGFTMSVPPNSKLPSEKIAYDESSFIRCIEQGDIPDELVPVLDDLTLLDNKLVVTITDYRGFPRPGSTQPYTLDFPITTQHVLSRSTQSLVLELYDTLGESLPYEQLTKLENYLLMLNSPPLCLETTTEVFEVKNDIHQSQNQLNNASVRRLIKEATKSDCINVLSDIVADMSLVLQHGKRDTPQFHSSKDSSVDGKLRKLKISCDARPPSFLSEILDLCKERMNRTVNVSPRAPGPPLQNLPHLKPAPFITNTKHPGPVSGGGINTPQTPAPSGSGAVIMTPISPNIPQQQPGSVHSMSSPLGPGTPGSMGPAPPIQSPKNVATVNRMPHDPSKGVRAAYNTGYIVPQQQMNPAQRPNQRMQVPMMQMGPGGQQQSPILPQPGGIIRGQAQPGGIIRGQAQPGGIIRGQAQPGGIIRGQAQPGGIIRGQAQPGGIIRGQAQPGGIIRGQMIHMTPSQQLRPVSSAGRMEQTMNNPRPNPGMMMPQQYPRSYQYPNVQQIPRSYVEPGGFIPMQQQRPAQVLQISLPPNMSPQPAARQARPTMGPNPGIAQPHQATLHRVPYNQMHVANIPNANMQNANMQNANMQNPNIYNQYR